MDEYERKLKYVGYCGCCQKDWESIKEMTSHVKYKQAVGFDGHEHQFRKWIFPSIDGYYYRVWKCTVCNISGPSELRSTWI